MDGAKDEGRERNAKFVLVSNVVGSIEALPFVPLDLMLYSVSGAGCSLLARENRLQHKELIVFAVHPGWVRTEMGNWRQAMRFVEMAEAPITIEEGLRTVEKLSAWVEHFNSLVRLVMEKVPSGVGLNTQETWCVHLIHRAQHWRH
jgi:NAD(P)-dependent dehydrogenase (short-subunit alcohol dehydrogenase family)